MRGAILACVMVAIVVAAAEPAGAIDDGFQDWYRLIAHQTDGEAAPALGLTGI
jgi:hypothetical protein